MRNSGWRTGVTVVLAVTIVAAAGAMLRVPPGASRAPDGSAGAGGDLRVVGRSLTAVGERYDLARSRASCSLCHTRLPGNPFAFTSFGQDYREILFRQNPLARNIFGVSMAEIERAVATSAEAGGLDSDGDGYDNDLELMFGSLPGDPSSHPSVPASVLEHYRQLIDAAQANGTLDRLQAQGAGKRPACPDSDNDGVVDCLETLFGFNPHSAQSVPLVRGGRLALYRVLLARDGIAAAR